MHFFVSTYSFSVEMVKINVSCLQKYNNLCDTQRNIYILTRESLKEILWIKFTH